jgi:hypothetical protein
MRTPSTPQYKAFQWLNGNANLKSYSDEQKVQPYVLAALYYSTGGDDWKSHDLWLDHGDECGRWWQEIGGKLECTADGAVRSLKFHLNNLVGSIPPELSWLSNSLSECLSSLGKANIFIIYLLSNDFVLFCNFQSIARCWLKQSNRASL